MDSAEAGRDGRAAGAEEVERLRRVLDEEAQRHLRLRADFENLHRRLAQERDAACQDGRRAAREVRRGWWVGNEMLRPAQVVVATDPEPAEWR